MVLSCPLPLLPCTVPHVPHCILQAVLNSVEQSGTSCIFLHRCRPPTLSVAWQPWVCRNRLSETWCGVAEIQTLAAAVPRNKDSYRHFLALPKSGGLGQRLRRWGRLSCSSETCFTSLLSVSVLSGSHESERHRGSCQYLREAAIRQILTDRRDAQAQRSKPLQRHTIFGIGWLKERVSTSPPWCRIHLSGGLLMGTVGTCLGCHD